MDTQETQTQTPAETVADSLNVLQLGGLSFVRIFTGNVPVKAEIVWTPKAAPASDAKNAPKAYVKVTACESGVGSNVVANGSTVATLLDSIPLAAAYVKHRLIGGNVRGPVPEDVKEAAKTAFYGTADRAKQVPTAVPELARAADLLIRKMVVSKPPTNHIITLRFDGVEQIVRISNRVKDAHINLATLSLPDAKLSLRMKNAKDEDVDVEIGTAAEIVSERRQLPTEIPVSAPPAPVVSDSIPDESEEIAA